jgi:Family of unknown function (DUF6328)
VDGRDETPKERHDRELIELLNELRVAMPGVQVLFAFLLAVPFAQGWGRVTRLQKDVFVVAFMAAACSSALLMAPSSIHRLGWRIADKERIVRVSNALSIAGLTLLALAVTASVFFLADVILSRGVAIACAAVVAVLYLATWYALAMYLRLRG